MRFKNLNLFWQVTLFPLLATSAYATIGNVDFGAGEINKGSAGVGAAMPQDALAAAINPAAIAFVPQSRVDAGVTVVHPKRGYQASGSALAPPMYAPIYPGNQHSGTPLIPFPSFGILYHPHTGPLTYALSVSGVGITTDYEVPVFGKGDAGIYYRQILTNFAAAWKVNPKLSLGSSFIVATQTLYADGLSAFAPLSNDPSDLSNEGTDYSFGAGVKIGFMYQPVHRVAFGASYSPEIAMSRFSKYQGLLPDSGSLDIPPTATAGLSVQVLPSLKAGFDMQYSWYDAVPGYENRFVCDLSTDAKCLGTTDGSGFGWRNVAAYKFGLVWDPRPTWTFRGGYLYATQPIRSSQILFATLAPATTQSHFTLGLTHTINQRFRLSAAALYAPRTSVRGVNPLAPDQKITVHLAEYELGISLAYLFGGASAHSYTQRR